MRRMQSRGVHHRRSVRLGGYDYSQPGAYFVTIVAHARGCIFGEISGGAVRLSGRGEVAEGCRRLIPRHFPPVELGRFVVMPNHIHGILVLHERATSSPGVGAHHALPLLRERRVEMGIGRLGNWVTTKSEPLSAPGREYAL